MQENSYKEEMMFRNFIGKNTLPAINRSRIVQAKRLSLLLAVSGLGIAMGCSSPRYKSNISSGIDQRIVYERGMDLASLMLERIEQAERGLEVRVRMNDLDEAYRPLQTWLAGIRDTGGEVDDRKGILKKYPVLQREGAPDKLAKFKNRVADKTEGLFNATAKNRREYFVKRYNLVLREEKQNLLFVFLPRGKLTK
jgi:hypothetical protein